MISGVFTIAKRLGYFDGVNPAQGTSVNPHAREAEETYAYSLEEINSMLVIFPETASTAFAVAAFAGLRRGEIEGLEWPDYHDGHCGFLAASGMVASCPQKPKKAKHPYRSFANWLIGSSSTACDAETPIVAPSSQVPLGIAYR